MTSAEGGKDEKEGNKSRLISSLTEEEEEKGGDR